YTPLFTFAYVNIGITFKAVKMATDTSRTTLLILLLSMSATSSWAQENINLSINATMEKVQIPGCSSRCTAKNESTEMTCKLTNPELRNRKETVIASLKKKMVKKIELKNGYAFKFPGTDDVLDELIEFI